MPSSASIRCNVLVHGVALKTYTAAGLGVAIVSAVAFNTRADRKLRALRASLLGKDTIYPGLRRHTYLRRFVYDFIQLFAPDVTTATVVKAVGLQL